MHKGVCLGVLRANFEHTKLLQGEVADVLEEQNLGSMGLAVALVLVTRFLLVMRRAGGVQTGYPDNNGDVLKNVCAEVPK